MQHPDYTIDTLTELEDMALLSQETVLKQAVLLSGGKGERMGKRTAHMQKCAIEYRNAPIIARPVRALLRNSIGDLCFMTAYRKDDISRLTRDGIAPGAQTRICETGEKKTGDALLHVKDILDDWFVYCHGDIIFDPLLLTQAIKRFYKNGCKKPVICVTKNPFAPTHPVFDMHGDTVNVVSGKQVQRLGEHQFYSIGLSILSKRVLFARTRGEPRGWMTEEYLSGIRRDRLEFLRYDDRWLHFCTADDLKQKDIDGDSGEDS